MKGELDWIKVSVNSFDDNKIRIISSMPQGDSVICIWFRLLFEAGKNNDEGYVYINEFIPYTYEMLGRIFNRSVKKVQYAIDTLKRFMMIEVDDDHFIKIKNWNKYQSIDKLEAIRESGKERTRKCRARKKAEMEAAKLQESNGLVNCNEETSLQKAQSYMDYNKEEKSQKAQRHMDYNEEEKLQKVQRNMNDTGDMNIDEYHSGSAQDNSHVDDSYNCNFEEQGNYYDNEDLSLKYRDLGLDYEDVVSEAAIDHEMVSKDNLLNEFKDDDCKIVNENNLFRESEDDDYKIINEDDCLRELGQDDYKSSILKELDESEYPEELQYKNSNGECNVTCNSGNVTVTDKIKNKKEKKIEIKTKEGEEERDRDVDKETDTNLKLSSNVTENVNECYGVTDNKALQKRYNDVTGNVSCCSNKDDESYQSAEGHTLKHNLPKDSLGDNSSKGIDQIIEEILQRNDADKNNHSKNVSLDIAYAMYVYYGNHTGNEKWLKVDDIRWMLIEHEWKYVKTAIEIVIAAGTLESMYVNRLLGKWKEDGYPKNI